MCTPCVAAHLPDSSKHCHKGRYMVAGFYKQFVHYHCGVTTALLYLSRTPNLGEMLWAVTGMVNSNVPHLSCVMHVKPAHSNCFHQLLSWCEPSTLMHTFTSPQVSTLVRTARPGQPVCGCPKSNATGGLTLPGSLGSTAARVQHYNITNNTNNLEAVGVGIKFTHNGMRYGWPPLPTL